MGKIRGSDAMSIGGVSTPAMADIDTAPRALRFVQKCHQLKPRLFQGLATEISNNVHFITEEVIIHPIGLVLVAENLVDHSQRYMNLPDNGKEVNLMALSPNKELVAVAEKGVVPMISIYNLIKKRKVRSFTNPVDQSAARSFAVLKFSSDNKFVVAVVSEPDWLLLFYDLAKGAINSTCRALYKGIRGTITDIACHPQETFSCIIAGSNLFRLMMLTSNNHKWVQYGFRVSPSDRVLVTGVCWVTPSCAIAGTKDGRLFATEFSDLKGVFRAIDTVEIELRLPEELIGKQYDVDLHGLSLTKEDLAGSHEVRALTSFEEGFAYSCASGYVVVFQRFEKDNSNTKWTRRGIYSVAGQGVGVIEAHFLDQVNTIAISPLQKQIVVTTHRTEIFYGYLDKETEDGGEISVPTPLQKYFNGFHQGPIASIASAEWKNIFMSCGLVDRCVIIWDYRTRKKRFRKKFNHDIFSAALHPTGFFCLIGFSDKLKLLLIYLDNMRAIKSVNIKACPVVEFSESGNLFAAVNCAYIEIYSAITCKKCFTLKGHVGPIRSLLFILNDTHLYSCGQEGSVYRWNLIDGTRELDINTRLNGNFECAANFDASVVYIVGTDGIMKELYHDEINRTFNLHQYSLYTIVISKSDSMLFVAGEKGAILSVAFPIRYPLVQNEFNMHTAPVVKVRIAYDQETLISISEDGALCMWEIIYPDDFEKEEESHEEMVTEVIVNYEEWRDKSLKHLDIKSRCKEKYEEKEYLMRKLVTANENAKRAIHNGFIEKIKSLQLRVEFLDKKHLREVGSLNMEISAEIEKHKDKKEAMQKEYDSLIASEIARGEKIFRVTRKFMFQQWEKLRSYTGVATSAMESYTTATNFKNRNIYDRKNLITQMIEDEKVSHADVKSQIEDDYDREIGELRFKFENLISKKKTLNNKLMSDNGLGMKRSDNLDDIIQVLRLEIAAVELENDKFKEFIQSLYHWLEKRKKEIEYLEYYTAQIDEALIKVYEYDKDNFHEKYVLDGRVEELRTRLEPLNNGIRAYWRLFYDQRDVVEEKNAALDHSSRTIVGINKWISYLTKSLKRQREVRSDMETMVAKMKNEIAECASAAFEPKVLVDAVKDMFNHYITRKRAEEVVNVDAKPSEELLHIRDHFIGIIHKLQAKRKAKPDVRTRMERLPSKSLMSRITKMMAYIHCYRFWYTVTKDRFNRFYKLTGIEPGQLLKEAQKKLVRTFNRIRALKQDMKIPQKEFHHLLRFNLHEIVRMIYIQHNDLIYMTNELPKCPIRRQSWKNSKRLRKPTTKEHQQRARYLFIRYVMEQMKAKRNAPALGQFCEEYEFGHMEDMKQVPDIQKVKTTTQSPISILLNEENIEDKVRRSAFKEKKNIEKKFQYHLIEYWRDIAEVLDSVMIKEEKKQKSSSDPVTWWPRTIEDLENPKQFKTNFMRYYRRSLYIIPRLARRQSLYTREEIRSRIKKLRHVKKVKPSILLKFLIKHRLEDKLKLTRKKLNRMVSNLRTHKLKDIISYELERQKPLKHKPTIYDKWANRQKPYLSFRQGDPLHAPHVPELSCHGQFYINRDSSIRYNQQENEEKYLQALGKHMHVVARRSLEEERLQLQQEAVQQDVEKISKKRQKLKIGKQLAEDDEDDDDGEEVEEEDVHPGSYSTKHRSYSTNIDEDLNSSESRSASSDSSSDSSGVTLENVAYDIEDYQRMRDKFEENEPDPVILFREFKSRPKEREQLDRFIDLILEYMTLKSLIKTMRIEQGQRSSVRDSFSTSDDERSGSPRTRSSELMHLFQTLKDAFGLPSPDPESSLLKPLKSDGSGSSVSNLNSKRERSPSDIKSDSDSADAGKFSKKPKAQDEDLRRMVRRKNIVRRSLVESYKRIRHQYRCSINFGKSNSISFSYKHIHPYDHEYIHKHYPISTSAYLCKKVFVCTPKLKFPGTVSDRHVWLRMYRFKFQNLNKQEEIDKLFLKEHFNISEEDDDTKLDSRRKTTFHPTLEKLVALMS